MPRSLRNGAWQHTFPKGVGHCSCKGFHLKEQEADMTRLALFAGTALLAVSINAMPAVAACNGDTSTETVLGAGSGAAVGGLASHSLGGAVIGGVAGGVIGNAIGHNNNRHDCRRQARAEQRAYHRDRDYPDRYREHYRDYDE
jgi:hypothetical protein